jgi:hypothetical protein
VGGSPKRRKERHGKPGNLKNHYNNIGVNITFTGTQHPTTLLHNYLLCSSNPIPKKTVW